MAVPRIHVPSPRKMAKQATTVDSARLRRSLSHFSIQEAMIVRRRAPIKPCEEQEEDNARSPGQQSGHGHARAYGHRSEEHTSELQSLRHLACRLLLEKK